MKCYKGTHTAHKIIRAPAIKVPNLEEKHSLISWMPTQLQTVFVLLCPYRVCVPVLVWLCFLG